MAETKLTGLDGSNPLAFLAALGVLVVTDRMREDSQAQLSWGGDATPMPALQGVGDASDLVENVLADRDCWKESACLDYPARSPAGDVKFSAEELRTWIEVCADAAPRDGGRSLGLVSALVAEGSLANKGTAKPTDLHFTAGRQQFLQMARTLRDELTATHVEEALFGPWRYDVKLPSFKWDVVDDRTYALAAIKPAQEDKMTVPGAEWLALNALPLLPVAWRPGRTITPGCSGLWEEGAFTWPVWDSPLGTLEVRTLLGLADLCTERVTPDLLARGVTRVFRSIITRNDQGGYGSFRPPRVMLDVAAGGPRIQGKGEGTM